MFNSSLLSNLLELTSQDLFHTLAEMLRKRQITFKEACSILEQKRKYGGQKTRD